MMQPYKQTAAAAVLAFFAAGVFTSHLAVAEEVTDTRSLAAFSRIVIKGAVDIAVKAGAEEQSVNVVAERRHLDRIETEVNGDTLTISHKGRRWRDMDVEIEIALVKLNGFVIDGAADAEVSNVDSEDFELIVNGAGDIDLDGTCGRAYFQINGAGDLSASDFKCREVEIEINGAGDADIFASETIIAVLNGVGDVQVYGNPSNIKPTIRGFGSFEIK